VALLMFPKNGLWDATANAGTVAYLIMWGLLTAVMFVGTLRLNRALQVIFGLLALLFFLLAAADHWGGAALKQFAGYEGVFCGFSAVYTALAHVLNEIYGRTVLPLGPVKQQPAQQHAVSVGQ
jgi:succinate-acetate transporter protein